MLEVSLACPLVGHLVKLGLLVKRHNLFVEKRLQSAGHVVAFGTKLACGLILTETVLQVLILAICLFFSYKTSSYLFAAILNCPIINQINLLSVDTRYKRGKKDKKQETGLIVDVWVKFLQTSPTMQQIFTHFFSISVEQLLALMTTEYESLSVFLNCSFAGLNVLACCHILDFCCLLSEDVNRASQDRESEKHFPEATVGSVNDPPFLKDTSAVILLPSVMAIQVA